jgi:hypothetical protein
MHSRLNRKFGVTGLFIINFTVGSIAIQFRFCDKLFIPVKRVIDVTHVCNTLRLCYGVLVCLCEIRYRFRAVDDFLQTTVRIQC